MVKAIPAPSLRELSSEARLRECTPMNVTAQKFQSQYALVCKPSAWRNHRTTLPQSRPMGVPAPSEREPGMGRTIQRAARKPQRCGRFSSPLRNSKTISRFPPENDTGWARAPTVWEPAQSVTEKTGWARAPTYRNQLKAQLKKELDKYAGH